VTPSSTDGCAPEAWTREEAIARLRPALRDLCGAEQSLCRVAADQGIFCGGFRRWPAREFHRRFRPYIGTSTHLTRLQMEAFADLWQLSEQVRVGMSLACDAASVSPGACRGWDELSNAELEMSCRELFGQNVTVGGIVVTVGGQPDHIDQTRLGLNKAELVGVNLPRVS
jgi:hypothetical protein